MMIKLLKSIGYKLVTNKTITNREFRVASQISTVNEDYSTFGKQVYDLTVEYELFLRTESYTKKKMMEILDSTRETGLDDIVMTIEEKENGVLITFTTIQEGTA